MPTYFVSAIEDHIAPWKTTYAGPSILGGTARFVLSGSGHIAGIVNPPAAKKYGYWTNEQLAPSADEWLAGAQQQLSGRPGVVSEEAVYNCHLKVLFRCLTALTIRQFATIELDKLKRSQVHF